MAEQYYNRGKDISKGPKLSKEFIQYIKDREFLDLHFRNATGNNPTTGLYIGTGNILSNDAHHSVDTKRRKKIETDTFKEWERILYGGFSSEDADEIIKEILSKEKRGGQYIDSEGDKKEGYYQTLVSRRYSLNYKKSDDFILFDKEFIIDYADNDVKDDKEGDVYSCAKGLVNDVFNNPEWEPGNKCDLIGITKSGNIKLIEVKKSTNNNLYLSPLQIGVYYKLLKKLIDDTDSWPKAKENIINLINYKRSHGLISNEWDWESSTKISDDVDIELAVVVGGVYEDKMRFNEVRKIVEQEIGKRIKLYTCGIDGTLQEDESLCYKELQQIRQRDLIEKKNLFNDPGNGGTLVPYILQECKNNLYKPDDFKAIKESKEGREFPFHIAFGNTTSSQASCLNHLWFIAHDKDAVLKMVQNLNPDIKKVHELKKDKFIDFEVTDDNNKDHLHEHPLYLTTIDAVILAEKNDETKIIIAIEWKYTEEYEELDLLTKGKKNRYEEKIAAELKSDINDDGLYYKKIFYKMTHEKQKKEQKIDVSHIYFTTTFYQLMRETLWAKSIRQYKHYDPKDKNLKDIDINGYLHIVVVPHGNKEWRYPNALDYRSIEYIWRNECLAENDRSKFIVIDPEDLFMPIKNSIDSNLRAYLEERYWKSWSPEER